MTYYRGPFVYHGTTLNHIVHPEGIVRKPSSGYIYYYAKADHTGSTRILCHKVGNSMAVDQSTDYYPYGLSHTNNNLDRNRYLYSGKEIQDQQLNGKMLQLYDFGSRNYDPILGRWFNIDPALQFTNPYLYCANSPMMCVDPDGRDAIYIAFPGYKAGGIPFTGHAGVLLINNQTGLTAYYEYGTYNDNESGEVRPLETYPVNIVDGMPTVESLDAVLKKISERNQNESLIGIYFKSDNFEDMLKWASDRDLKNGGEVKMDDYNLLSNNCATFSFEVIGQDSKINIPLIQVHPVLNLEFYNTHQSRVISNKSGTSLTYEINNKNTIKTYERTTGTSEEKDPWWQFWN